MDQQDDAAVKDGRLKLMDNPLDSLRTGASLDLRVKIAMDLLAHSPMYHGVVVAALEGKASNPHMIAEHALKVADSLIVLAQEGGLFEPLDSPEGMERLKEHVRRQTEFQAEAAREAGRAQADSLSLARAVSGALRKN